MSECATYNFKREEIIKHCEGIEGLQEQIIYLRSVLKEYKTEPPDLDENYGIKPTLKDFIEEHIEYRKFLIELPESKAAGLVKIRGKNINIDIVRIFNAMIDAEIISNKTEVKQIVRLFFSEQVDIEKNAASYNARIGEIEREQKSNSKVLMKFIKVLIEKSYKGKSNSIIELQKYLDKL